MNVLLTMWMGHRVTPPSITRVSIVTHTKTHPCSFSHSHSYLPGKRDDMHMVGFQVFHNPPTCVSLLGQTVWTWPGTMNHRARGISPTVNTDGLKPCKMSFHFLTLKMLELHATPNKCHRRVSCRCGPASLSSSVEKRRAKCFTYSMSVAATVSSGGACHAFVQIFLCANTQSRQEESITHRLWRTELVWDWRKDCGFSSRTVSWSDHRLLDPLLAVKTEWQ